MVRVRSGASKLDASTLEERPRRSISTIPCPGPGGILSPNPLAAALGLHGESEMLLAKQVLAAQPAHSLLLLDRYYGVPQPLTPLPATAARHFLVQAKQTSGGGCWRSIPMAARWWKSVRGSRPAWCARS